jgi:hypothetical protein
MAKYRVSMNTNSNSNETIQDPKNEREREITEKQNKKRPS